jgi:hypothetical protein
MAARESSPKEQTMAGKNQGEGNRDADRRYREGVQKTVEETTEEERAEKALDLSNDELIEAEDAEDEGREHARH